MTTVQQTATITVTIQAGLVPITVPNPIVLPVGVSGQPYTADLSTYVSGGVPPYTFTPSTTLPTGWSLTPAGLLSIQSYPATQVQVDVGTVTDTGGQ